MYLICFCFFFQAEDGIRDLVRSRGLGDVYKRQHLIHEVHVHSVRGEHFHILSRSQFFQQYQEENNPCLLYTSDAADERSSVDLGGRRIIKKKKQQNH